MKVAPPDKKPRKQRPGPKRRNWERVQQATSIAILLAVAGTAAFPFYAMVVLALKSTNTLVFPDALTLSPSTLTLDNFDLIMSRAPRILRWLANSAIYAFASVILTLLISTMAGYAFARKRFRGKEVIFWTTLAMLMVPFQVTLVPLFILISKLGWIDTFWGLIIPGIATTQGVFLMRQFIAQLPSELFEAARLDGAGDWRIFWSVVVPLVRPALATLGVFVFLWHWNDFLWPLVVGQSDSMRTLTVGLSTLQAEQTPIGVMMASATISFVPSILVFLLLQRAYVQGVVTSGIK